MTTSDARGLRLAHAAAALVGCRFRLHGRDPANGLDCIGVLAAALQAIGRTAAFPSGYRLRNGGEERLPALADAHGFGPAHGADRPGDVWLLRPGPGQLHLAILADPAAAAIEAHAGLRRVVLSPLQDAARPVARWRLCAD